MVHKKLLKSSLIIALAVIMLFSVVAVVEKVLATNDNQWTVSAHVQGIGWMDTVSNIPVLTEKPSDDATPVAIIGTTGEAKRLEALDINVPENITLQYRAHIQNLGWEQGWRTADDKLISKDAKTADATEKDKTVVGTVNEALRLEALQIAVSGEGAADYDVYYRAHVQTYGWEPWVKALDATVEAYPEDEEANETFAGTTGQYKRLEAIEIVLVHINHVYENWEDNGNGEHTGTCTVCGATKTEAHELDYTITEENHQQHCTKCDFCEKAVAHEFGECLPNEDAETHTKTCATCGFAKTEDCNMQLSFKNHTCTEEGWVGHQECTVCGRNKDKREITPAAHTYTRNQLVDNGNGTHSRKCDICGELEEATDCTYKPHDLGNGMHEEVCEACGHKKAEPVKHTYGTEYKQSEDGTQHYQVCTLCGAESEKEAHTEKVTEGNVEGHKVVCEVCGETLEENVAHTLKYENVTHNDGTMNGTHKQVCTECGYATEATKCTNLDSKNKYIPHTQTEEGGTYATVVCKDCGDEYKVLVRKENHKFGAYLPDEDAQTHTRTCEICGLTETDNCDMKLSFKNHTCTEDGWVGHYECTVCGRDKDKRQLTPAAHTYTRNQLVDNGNGTHSRKCDVCGELEEATDCTYKPHDLGNGTHEEVCEVCGHKKAEPVAHTYGTEYLQSEDGTMHYQVCTVCGAESEKVAHTEKATEGTADGHKVVCEICETVIKESAPHEYKYKEGSGDGTIGDHIHVCDCGYEVDVDEDGGEFGNLVTENVEHTQTEIGGQKATRTCSCGYSFSWHMRPTGHTYFDLTYSDLNSADVWILTCETCHKNIEFTNLKDYFDVTEPTCTEWAKIKLKTRNFEDEDYFNKNSILVTETSVEELLDDMVDDNVIEDFENAEKYQKAMAEKLGLAPLGHEWKEITDEDVEWDVTTDEFGEVSEVTATATVVCENDEEHKETVTAKLSEETIVKKATFKDVTCENEGQYDFTATFNLEDGTVMTADYSETISALGHHFDDLSYIGTMFGEEYNSWSLSCKNGYTIINGRKNHGHPVTFDNIEEYFNIVEEPTCTKYAVIKFNDNGVDKSDIYNENTSVETIANEDVFVDESTLEGDKDAINEVIRSVGLLKEHTRTNNYVKQNSGYDLICDVCGDTGKNRYHYNTLVEVFAANQKASVTVPKNLTLKLSTDTIIPDGAKVTVKGTLNIGNHKLTVSGEEGLVFEEGAKLISNNGTIENIENVIGYDFVKSSVEGTLKADYNVSEENVSELNEILKDKSTEKVVLKADATLDNQVTVGEDVTLVVDDGATLNAEEDLTINGKLEIKGELIITKSLKSSTTGNEVTVSGNLVVKGTLGNENLKIEGEGTVELANGTADENGTNLQNAVKAGAENVEISENAKVSEIVNVENLTVTIDSGKTVETSNENLAVFDVENGKTLEIKGPEDPNSDKPVLKVANEGADKGAVVENMGGTVNISNVELDGQCGVLLGKDNADTTLTNVTIKTKSIGVSSNNGENYVTAKGKVNLTLIDCDITSECAAGVYLPAQGEVTIERGSIKGLSAIVTKGANLTLKGDLKLTGTDTRSTTKRVSERMLDEGCSQCYCNGSPLLIVKQKGYGDGEDVTVDIGKDVTFAYEGNDNQHYDVEIVGLNNVTSENDGAKLVVKYTKITDETLETNGENFKPDNINAAKPYFLDLGTKFKGSITINETVHKAAQ